MPANTKAIFQEIDAAAQSSLGSEYLYSKLRLQSFESDLVFEQLQIYLQKHPKERLQLQFLFAQLGKKNYNHAKKLVLRPIKPNYWWPFYILHYIILILIDTTGIIDVTIVFLLFSIFIRVRVNPNST